MSKKYMYLFGAALLALTGVGASAQSAQAKAAHHVRRTHVTRTYTRYFVNAPASISSNTKTISGTATPDSHVLLQNGHKTVDSTYASKDGRYVLNVPKHFRAGTSLRVMAKKGYEYPYRYVTVKTPANQKAAVKKAAKKTARKPARKLTKKSTKRNQKANQKLAKKANKKVNRKRARARKATKKRSQKFVKKTNRRVARKATHKAVKFAGTPTGTWTAKQSKNYSQKWSFTQARGLNETLYHHGRYAKKLVTNARYHVNAVKPNLWKITYKSVRTHKSGTIYMHLLTSNRFQVTNAKGRKPSMNFLRA